MEWFMIKCALCVYGLSETGVLKLLGLSTLSSSRSASPPAAPGGLCGVERMVE